MSVAEFVYTVLLEPKPLRAAANAVLRSIARPSVTIHDAHVVLNPRDPVISGALTLGIYERPETDVFLQLLKPGDVMLDIGANVGYYTALATRVLLPAGRIVALEPDPDSFYYLQQTVLANTGAQVLCINKAAGSEQRTATLFTSSDNRGDNRLYANDLANGSCEVEVISIDALLEQLDIPCVQVVKIDVQGFEEQVLWGMRRTLAASPNVAMMMEFWPSGIVAAGSQPLSVLELLEKHAFRLFEILPHGRMTRVASHQDLIGRHQGRRYANLVACKGETLAVERHA